MPCQTRLLKDRSLCGGNRWSQTTGPTPSRCKTTATWCWPSRGQAMWATCDQRPGCGARRSAVRRQFRRSTRRTNRSGTATPRARRTSNSCFRTIATWCSTPLTDAAWSTKTETAEPAATAAAEAAAEGSARATSREARRGSRRGSRRRSRPPEPAARTYTVEAGDTLWAIAERFYGDGSKYQVIADASGVPNPDLIQPGPGAHDSLIAVPPSRPGIRATCGFGRLRRAKSAAP